MIVYCKIIIIFQMTDKRSEDEMMEIETYHIKYYEPSNYLEKLSYMLIRPPRLLYNEELLRPQKVYGKRFQHTVFYIPFPLSLYEPKKMEYVILYLHGNSSSRIQGFHQLAYLPKHVGLACFDFDGCGNRLQRKFISLGKSQSLEVDIAAAFLRGKGYKVVGWGRSMGSVSLLLSSQCQIVVADSPFSSLKRLCYQKSSREVPYLCKPFLYCLFPCLLGCIGYDIEKKTNIRFDDLELVHQINQNKDRSILFLAGTEDTLIDYKHAQTLYQKFEGRKHILLFQGDHHSDRSIDILAIAYVWIQNEMEFIEDKQANQIQKALTLPLKKEGKTKSLSQLGVQNDYHFLQSVSNNQSAQRLAGEKMESIEEKVVQVEEQVKESSISLTGRA